MKPARRKANYHNLTKPHRREVKVECVYFIFAPESRMTKIGRTTKINKRMSSLRGASPTRLELCHKVITKNSVVLEARLHKKFAHLRSHGEWFQHTKEIDDMIHWFRNNKAAFRKWDEEETDRVLAHLKHWQLHQVGRPRNRSRG